MDLINNLPNEILIEIFEYCKVLPLTLVCKKFDNIISSSSQLMRSLSLVIKDKPAYSDLLVKSVRNHQSVSFKFNYKINEDCLQIFEKFKEVKSLDLTRSIVSAEDFRKILSLLPKLEKLSIYSSHMKNKDHLELTEPPKLKSLKSLNFRNSDVAFLHSLRRSSIETIFAALPVTDLQNTFPSFLRSQTRLKNIEYLSTLGGDGTLISVITQELPCLESVHINANELNSAAVRNLELTNSSVRHLNFSGTTETAASFHQIVNIFKNLISLEIEMSLLLENAEVVIQLQQQRPNLERLHLTQCSGDFFNRIHFRCLKDLRLTDGGYATDDWLRFASRNPSIEILAIRDESMTNEVFRIISLEFRHLRHFEMFFDPQRLTPEILDFIFDPAFPSNIRSLKITQRARSGETFFTLTDQHKAVLNERLGFNCIFH